MDLLKEISALNIGNAVLVLVFIVPGFISMKTYEQLFPVASRDYSRLLINAIVYSTIHYCVFAWPISHLLVNDWWNTNRFSFIICAILIVVVAPGLWPLAYEKFFSKLLARITDIHPLQRPWDFVFKKGRWYWVVVHLKNGDRIGGLYAKDSFTSSYPEEPQIYLQQLWKLGKKKKDPLFERPIERSEGTIILGSEIRSMDLYSYQPNACDIKK